MLLQTTPAITKYCFILFNYATVRKSQAVFWWLCQPFYHSKRLSGHDNLYFEQQRLVTLHRNIKY